MVVFILEEIMIMTSVMELIALIVCAIGSSIGIIGSSLILANKLTLNGERVFQVIELSFLIASIILLVISFFA